VVVQIARADAQMSSNMIGGDIALALFIEQFQAFLNDAVVGLDAGFAHEAPKQWGKRGL
jgi:hypothetical protein